MEYTDFEEYCKQIRGTEAWWENTMEWTRAVHTPEIGRAASATQVWEV